MKLKRIHFLGLGLAMVVAAIPFRRRLRSAFLGTLQEVKGRKTVDERLAEFEAAVRARLQENFEKAKLIFPPSRLVFVGLKEERALEVWAANVGGPLRHLKTYPILGASGNLGPKLAEGDRQVPEGLYRVESLNPNSAFHVALRVNYPNAYDRAKGAADGRAELGSDIMIHGSSASIGCLARGDPAAEELFTLAARAGLANVSIILSPVDFRRRDLPAELIALPSWTLELYAQIKTALQAL